jgi:thioredoxin 1
VERIDNMQNLTALYREAAALAAVLACLTLLTGCGATKSLLGKRSSPATKETTELAAQTEKEDGNDGQDLLYGGYPQEQSLAEVALASANSRGDAPVVQAVAQMDFAANSSHEFSGTVQHIGTHDFEQQVLNSNVPVLVDFYADWCGPCKKLSPTLDRIASETPGAKVVKVNIDESPRIASKYGVSSVPTVMVFKNGAAVARNRGLASQSKLMQMLAQ